MNQIIREGRYYGFTHLFFIMLILCLFAVFTERFNRENIIYLLYLLPNKNELKLGVSIYLSLFIRSFIFFNMGRSLLFINLSEIIYFVINIFYIKNYLVSMIVGLSSLIQYLKMFSFYIDSSTMNLKLGTIFNKKYKEGKLYTFKSFCRFIFLPTLIFSESFYTSKFSLKNLLKSIGNLLLATIILCVLYTFYLIPSILGLGYDSINSTPTSIMYFVFFSILFWLSGFYFFFIGVLDFLGEVFLFRRENYKLWWNCKNTKEFWRMWNFQTYEYMKKYLVKRMARFGFLRNAVVFLVSAVVHEYISVFIFKAIYGVAFGAMLLQSFLFFLESKLVMGGGNLFFWIVFCVIGQPFSLLTLKYCIQGEFD